MLKIPRKQPRRRVFKTIFLHSQIRLHLPISFFPAKCNLNRGNLIGPGTVSYFPEQFLTEYIDMKYSIHSKL